MRHSPGRLPVLAAILLLTASPISAQTRVEPGFNLLSEQDDVELGRQAAGEIERELPLLENRTVTRYIDRVGSRLAEHAPGYDFPYQFEVVDVRELNAFALPGGFMYVNRGLIAALHSESALAGVMAHEIAHVALRHSTNQASKAYLGSAGLSLLTGLIGDRTASDVVGAVGGFGLNSLFLKYSRDDEREADIVGAQILARAGYDPRSLTRAFETLHTAAQQAGASSVPTFFSSHPPYDERVQLVQREADQLGNVQLRRPVGDLERVQAELASMPPAASMERYVTDGGTVERDDRDGETTLPDVRIEPPSTEWETYTHPRGYYRISTPANWLVREAGDRFGATFVPRGGAATLADGREEIVYGVMIDHFSPEDVNAFGRRWRGFTTEGDWDAPSGSDEWLERASHELVDTLQASNPHLTVSPGTGRFTEVDRERAYLVTLEGHNPITDRAERVTVVTRETDGDGHLVYALLIAPEEQWTWMTTTFERMMDTLQIDDRAVHASDS